MEPEIVIMVASFLCGVLGMAFAKKAKEKNSYPFIVASGISAVLTFVGLITAAVLIFFVK